MRGGSKKEIGDLGGISCRSADWPNGGRRRRISAKGGGIGIEPHVADVVISRTGVESIITDDKYYLVLVKNIGGERTNARAAGFVNAQLVRLERIADDVDF